MYNNFFENVISSFLSADFVTIIIESYQLRSNFTRP